MQRREFIGLIGGAAAWPVVAQAQQGARMQQAALPVIGFLTGVSFQASPAFRSGLSEQGYVESRNVRIEYRSANGQYDRLPGLAAELVALQVNVIFANPGVSALAAKGATSKTPIIFFIGIDPVEAGLVASFNSPGSNVTGVCVWQASMTPKLFEMLDELLPKSAPFTFLTNSNNSQSERASKRAEVAAADLGRSLVVVGAGTEREIDHIFENLEQRGGGLIVEQEIFLQSRHRQIAALGLRYKLPVLFAHRPFAEAGGLISYSANLPELARQAGIYVGKILNGASPASLPVFQPAKYELVINLKTAKAIGLEIPSTLLAGADEVIE